MKGFFEKEDIEKGNEQSNCLKCNMKSVILNTLKSIKSRLKFTSDVSKETFIVEFNNGDYWRFEYSTGDGLKAAIKNITKLGKEEFKNIRKITSS